MYISTLKIIFTVNNGGAAVAEWISSWFAEQEVQDLIPRLATWILEIGYLLIPSRDMAEIPLKRPKSTIQPTNQQSKTTKEKNKSMYLTFKEN